MSKDLYDGGEDREDCFVERFLWVDAIFINQKDKGVDEDRSIHMTRTMR
jgi:hypothetical protein